MLKCYQCKTISIGGRGQTLLMSERSGPPRRAKRVMPVGSCLRVIVLSPFGVALKRSRAFRRFNSRKAFDVSRNWDSESQYERSVLSQVDQEQSVEEWVEELEEG